MRTKAQIHKYQSEHYFKNKVEISRRHKQYYLLHKSQYLSYRKKYKVIKIENPWLRLYDSLDARFMAVLKTLKRYYSISQIVGCSLEQLKQHLESKFQPGMNWENYGRNGWHVDHIIPCKRFNFANPLDQLACFHYLNTQPLWAEDNYSKGNK